MSKLSESQKEEVKEMIAFKMVLNVEKVLDSSKMQDIGADSLDVVDIVMGLESKFDISIPDEDHDDITDVASLYEIVERYIY